MDDRSRRSAACPLTDEILLLREFEGLSYQEIGQRCS